MRMFVFNKEYTDVTVGKVYTSVDGWWADDIGDPRCCPFDDKFGVGVYGNYTQEITLKDYIECD